MEYRADPRRRRAQHQIPTHLNVPDKILSFWGFGLTVRQLLVLLIGWSVAANVWVRLGWLSRLGTLGIAFHLVLVAIPVVLALIVAFKEVAGRSLEVWALVLLRYLLQPRVCVWRSVRQERRTRGPRDVATGQESRGAGRRVGRTSLWTFDERSE